MNREKIEILLIRIGFCVRQSSENWNDYEIVSKNITYVITLFNSSTEIFYTEIIDNSHNSHKFNYDTDENTKVFIDYLKLLFNVELRKNKIKEMLDE